MALPSNYKQLEWIESTGTQYINTGLNTSIKRKIEIGLSTTSTSRYNIYGSGGGDQSSQITYSIRVGSSSYPKFSFLSRSNSPGTTITDVNEDINKHDIVLDIKNAIGTIDGVDYTLYQNTGTTSYREYVFAYSRLGTVDNSYSFVGRVYYAKYYEDDILVRDFIPVKNLNTNIIGLYDLINDVFYTNAGTGTFNYPWEISAEINHSDAGTVSGTGFYANGDTTTIQAIPNQGYLFKNWILNGYTRLDYIEATGVQYIDTGITPEQMINLRIESDMCWTTVPSDNQFLGSRQSSGDTRRYLIYGYQSKFVIGANTMQSSNVTIVANQKYHIESQLKSGDSWLKIDNETVATQTTTLTNTGNQSLYLFAYTNGSSVQTSYRASAKMWYLKCYDATTGDLLRDFIPVMRNSDCIIGLLDLVNLKFYKDEGSNYFMGG